MDFSSRQLPRRSKDKTSDKLSPLFLTAFSKLKHCATALFLITVGKNFFSWSDEQVVINGEELPKPFENSLPAHAYHDYYYLNANSFNLLLHLPFLKAKNKPLLINEVLLDQSARAAVEKILQQAQLTYVIATEEEIAKKLDAESATVLLIDDTPYFKKLDEAVLDPKFQHGHVQISRFNADVSPRKYDVFFSFNEVKAKQIAHKIVQLTDLTYLNKTLRGIQNYLSWHAEHAQGTRGLTRFSHWYHGESGKIRAEHLQTVIINALANPNSINFPTLKASIKEQLKGSSNAQHSLDRFICASLTEDIELETLPDREYRAIRAQG